MITGICSPHMSSVSLRLYKSKNRSLCIIIVAMLPHMFSIFALLGAASASPVFQRASTSQANCRSFYADIYAQAENVNLESVIGSA